MKILFLGDFLYDFDRLNTDFLEICEYIIRKGLRPIINLETALGSEGSPVKKGGPNIRSTETIFDALKSINVLAVTMANNHTMDFGGKALEDAISRLDEKKIARVGAGRNIDEAGKPLFLKTSEKDIIIINAGWYVEETVYATDKSQGCNALNRDKLVNQVDMLRKEHPESMIILIPHWGFEFNTYPMPLDIAFAHECIDHGCNLIIGHHPHVIQAKEVYKGVSVYYSLGNFYSGSHRDHFPVNYQHEPYSNMSDYGLGVIYDTKTDSCEELFFFYDRDLDRTEIISENPGVMKDITGVEWNSAEYRTLAKMHANNSNPILGIDQKENRISIAKLLIKHRIAINLRFLKKSSAGRRIYSILKKIAG